MDRPTHPAPLFTRVTRPLRAFFNLEAAGGILLLAASLVALFWVNSAWGDSYHGLLALPVGLTLGGLGFSTTLSTFVNDGLMTLFFLVVGMEIKREMLVGELRDWRSALLPAIAALGGMIVPAGIYFALNRGGPGESGWGIPVATDIAFAVGCLRALGKRVPYSLVVFLTALAIFDDIGGILVIAFFYGSGVQLAWLVGAAVLTAAIALAGRLKVRNGLFYGVGGIALWYLLHHAGIHATIAGVVLGMCIPAFPLRPLGEVLRELHTFVGSLIARPQGIPLENAQVLAIEERLEDLEPPINRFIHVLHPYVTFGIVPLFALTNAGVPVMGMGLASVATAVPLGVILGLVLGKPLGIFGATWIALKLRVGPMPTGATWGKLFGVSIIAGIGFTVSLFIANLAFPTAPGLLGEAKLGVLLGSAASAVVGALLLFLLPSPPASDPEAAEA